MIQVALMRRLTKRNVTAHPRLLAVLFLVGQLDARATRAAPNATGQAKSRDCAAIRAHQDWVLALLWGGWIHLAGIADPPAQRNMP